MLSPKQKIVSHETSKIRRKNTLNHPFLALQRGIGKLKAKKEERMATVPSKWQMKECGYTQGRTGGAHCEGARGIQLARGDMLRISVCMVHDTLDT